MIQVMKDQDHFHFLFKSASLKSRKVLGLYGGSNLEKPGETWQ